MPFHLHLSDDTAEPRQTSFTNTPRKINFLLHKIRQKKEQHTVTRSFFHLCHPLAEVKFLTQDTPQTIFAVN